MAQADRVNVTDGREVLSVPATAVHAMESLGWERTEEAPKPPAKKPAPKRREPKPTLEGVATNRSK